MKQDLPDTICGDLLRIAMVLSIFGLAAGVTVSGPFWSIAIFFNGPAVPG
jgi:hypothetical protein